LANIVIIDDDLAMDIFTANLRYRGHEAYRIGSVSEAMSNIDQVVTMDLVVLDIIMPWPTTIERSEVSASRSAGMEILRTIRTHNKDLPIIAYSAIQDADLIDALSADQHTIFLSKWSINSIGELVGKVYKVLGLDDIQPSLVPFIVHGRNEVAKLSLKNYLQNTLKLSEPIILHEQPNKGRTIIEKFEDYARQACLVFVLLTPDDVVATADESEESKRRARQNVIFEMGYFLGILGRRSGRVLLLHQGPIELPSDISGIVDIDISNGIEAAGEQIRREVQHVK